MSEEKEQFKEFFEKHPSLDNAEYYAEFPDVNKSTIRSWKYTMLKQNEPKPEPAPAPPTTTDYTELENEHIKMLITQTKSDPKELEGLDNKSKLMILKNRLKVIEENKVREPNSSILPAPRPEHITKKRFGIDDYIVFDKEKGEIRMEIPCDVLFDPKKNKGLGLIK